MQSILGALLGTDSQSRDYTPVLKWILINALAVFGLLVLWYFGVIGNIVDNDSTRISLVIAAIFVLMVVHCGYQTMVVSRELVAARKVRDAIASSGSRALRIVDDKIVTAQGETLEPGILTRHISNLIHKARTLGPDQHLDQTVLLRSLADQLRSREKLGIFVAEALLRLALLGTAVGFILMLIPISGLGQFDVESLRMTLTGMTDGMAIALNITVSGIAAALLLKFEYYLLDEAIADLFRTITEVTEVHVVPTLEPRSPSGGPGGSASGMSGANIDMAGSVAAGGAMQAKAADRSAASDQRSDDLEKIHGIGPVVAKKLHDWGVHRYDQIAAWNDDDVARFDRELSFRGRIHREDWVGQAQALHSRDLG